MKMDGWMDGWNSIQIVIRCDILFVYLSDKANNIDLSGTSAIHLSTTNSDTYLLIID